MISLIDLEKNQSFFLWRFHLQSAIKTHKRNATFHFSIILIILFLITLHTSSRFFSLFAIRRTTHKARSYRRAVFLTQLKVIKDWRREIRWEDNKERAQLQMARHRIQRVFFLIFSWASAKQPGLLPPFELEPSARPVTQSYYYFGGVTRSAPFAVPPNWNLFGELDTTVVLFALMPRPLHDQCASGIYASRVFMTERADTSKSHRHTFNL